MYWADAKIWILLTVREGFYKINLVNLLVFRIWRYTVYPLYVLQRLHRNQTNSIQGSVSLVWTPCPKFGHLLSSKNIDFSRKIFANNVNELLFVKLFQLSNGDYIFSFMPHGALNLIPKTGG